MLRTKGLSEAARFTKGARSFPKKLVFPLPHIQVGKETYSTQQASSQTATAPPNRVLHGHRSQKESKSQSRSLGARLR